MKDTAYLMKEVKSLRDENASLKERIKELETELRSHRP